MDLLVQSLRNIRYWIFRWTTQALSKVVRQLLYRMCMTKQKLLLWTVQLSQLTKTLKVTNSLRKKTWRLMFLTVKRIRLQLRQLSLAKWLRKRQKVSLNGQRHLTSWPKLLRMRTVMLWVIKRSPFLMCIARTWRFRLTVQLLRPIKMKKAMNFQALKKSLRINQAELTTKQHLKTFKVQRMQQ